MKMYELYTKASNYLLSKLPDQMAQEGGTAKPPSLPYSLLAMVSTHSQRLIFVPTPPYSSLLFSDSVKPKCLPLVPQHMSVAS